MIIHFQHHKEGRNFNVRPVTGNYTDVHVYINVKRFKHSPYFEGEFKYYPFVFNYDKKEALDLIERVNTACNAIVLVYCEDSSGVRMSSEFPEILDEMPSDNLLPVVYKTNPKRLVEVIIA